MKKEQAIKINISYEPSGQFAADAALIRQMEADGIETVWITERRRNPFFPLTIAAQSTRSIGLATLDALAFPRSPMVTAQIAWDLARQSRGRFILGLSAHSPPSVVEGSNQHPQDVADRMREYFESLRAIWDTFQNNARLRYRGQYYQFRLMAPFFNPGPIDHPDIPIFISADDLDCCQLAGETCQGIHVPRLHTLNHLRDVILPAATRGLELAGRSRDDFCISVPLLIVTGSSREETERAVRVAKTRIALLASAGTGGDVLQHHGWQDFLDVSQHQANPAQQADPWRNVSDEMLREVAIVAEPEDIADAISARFQGIADRVVIPWTHEDLERIPRIASKLSE